MTNDSSAADHAHADGQPTFAERLAEAGESEDFGAWLQLGMQQGWAGPTICHTHDGLPTSEAEEVAAWGVEGDDADEGDGEYPCMHIIRLYESHDVRDAVEEHHAPSVWRKPRV